MEKTKTLPALPLFEGQWDWRETNLHTAAGWLTVKQFEPKEHIWNFRPDGIMASEVQGSLCYLVRYAYHQNVNILYLEGVEIGQHGNPCAVVLEKYRVVFLNRNEVFLFDMDNVEREPEDYSLRLTLKRIRYT